MPLAEDTIIWITDNRGLSIETWTPEGKEEVYSILPVSKGYDGKLYYDWVRYSYWDKHEKKKVQEEKDRPLKIRLGTKKEALAALHSVFESISGVEAPNTPTQDDDVPF